MPLAAVIPAVFAGAQIATVGIAAMSTMAVIGAVGAIAAGVGAVTGNKDLMKIGAVAGLVGGVGAFAQGQGWLAGDLAKGADAGGLAGAEAAGSDYGAGSAAEATAIDSALAAQAPGVADPTSGLVGSADPSAAGYTNAMDMASDAAGSSATSVADAAGTAGDAGGGLMNTPLSPLAAQDVGSLGGVASVTAGAPATSGSIFDTIGKVGDFMNKNKELASLGLNFVGGMFDDKKKAEAAQANAAVGLYEAKTGSELLQQDILRQQTANANAVPDMTGLKLNPAVKVFNTEASPTYRAPRAGLINSTGR